MQATRCTLRTLICYGPRRLRPHHALPGVTPADRFQPLFCGQLDSPFPGMFVEIATLIDPGDEAIEL